MVWKNSILVCLKGIGKKIDGHIFLIKMVLFYQIGWGFGQLYGYVSHKKSKNDLDLRVVLAKENSME